MNDNREGAETEKWESHVIDLAREIVRGFLRKDNTWLRTHGDAFSTLVRETVERINESLSSLQQPKEQGLEEKSLGKKEALSDHHARPTDGAWQEFPNEQGVWWWWNGDEDCAPVPIHIAFSGSDGSYFATIGQYGWDQPQNVRSMGGWWMLIVEPVIPRHLSENGGEPSNATGVSSPTQYPKDVQDFIDAHHNPIVQQKSETISSLQQQLQKKDREQKDMLDRWEELQRALRLGPDDDYFAGPLRKANNTIEVARWAQAVLTAWNTGDLQKDSPLHKKLREVMIAYRSPALGNKTADVSAKRDFGICMERCVKKAVSKEGYCQFHFDQFCKREPAVTATPAPKQDELLPCPALPVPHGLDFRNAGHKCDQLFGPCACGAWHTFDDLAFRIFNQLKTRADHAPSIDGEQGK